MPRRGTLVAVCLSGQKGTAKEPVEMGKLVADWGLEGDAHAGTERQLSLLNEEKALQLTRAYGLPYRPGVFAENLVVRDLDLDQLQPGDRLRVGEALLEVVQRGKEAKPHHYSYHGLRLLPTDGIFCRVVKGGLVRQGDPVEQV
ncbi:MOSC domain-containing protein [Ammonifex thiophilus]|uniref:MOSC domain-containing protein n=1 Tax=Ammonifex thiophilus TaxID=444093 RepID=UPI001F0C4A1C|nr:MOSC domain-containing protein [Ammonifex thiophilus]